MHWTVKPWIWYVSVFVFWLLGCAVSDCDGQTLCYLCDSRWADRSSMAGGPGRSGRSTTAPRPWWCCRRCWPGRTRSWRKPLHVHKHKFICEQNKKSVNDFKKKIKRIFPRHTHQLLSALVRWFSRHQRFPSGASVQSPAPDRAKGCPRTPGRWDMGWGTHLNILIQLSGINTWNNTIFFHPFLLRQTV